MGYLELIWSRWSRTPSVKSQRHCRLFPSLQELGQCSQSGQKLNTHSREDEILGKYKIHMNSEGIVVCCTQGLINDNSSSKKKD